MRIIFYSPHPTHDIVSEVGYSTHQREIINALRQSGHEVISIILGGDNTGEHRIIFDQKTKTSIFKKSFKKIIPRFIWTSLNNYKLLLHDRVAEKRLEKTILKYPPDLIYERSEYLQDSGARMALKYGIRYFLEVNAPFVEEMRHFEGFSLYQWKAHKVEKFKLDTAQKIFSVSSALSAFLIKKYHCDSKKIILQPNCINLNILNQFKSEKSLIMNGLNIGNEKVIGFVGSIFPYHGVDVLIKAFAEVYKVNTAIKLLIVGDGTIVPELKQLSLKLRTGNSVIFAGKIPHNRVFDYIDIMDICVMAKSNWYGSPVKIFEYGLMKKPIIAPDTMPVKDVLKHNESGLIVDNNELSLASAILRYLNNQAFADLCAINFYEKVINEYTWQKAADKIIMECA